MTRRERKELEEKPAQAHKLALGPADASPANDWLSSLKT